MKASQVSSYKYAAPVAALIFLSPVLTELLMGVVHVTNLWLLVPEMGVYGCVALIIREVTRRLKRGWGTMLLLGMAFSIAEECVILQTSLTPQFFAAAPKVSFGWAAGVQWIYLTAMLWYESVYAVVLPIYLTELLFPRQRDELWLGRRGLAISAGIFLLSAIAAWWLWGHAGVLKYGPNTYQVPATHVVLALVAIAVLVSGTLLLRPSRPVRKADRRPWSPWLVGLVAFIHGLAWFLLIVLAYIPASVFQGITPAIPIAIGLAWVGLGLLAVRYLSRSQGWQDQHRLALIMGASLASMLGGVTVILSASPIDQVGKLAFDLTAIILMAALAVRLRKRHSQVPGAPQPTAGSSLRSGGTNT